VISCRVGGRGFVVMALWFDAMKRNNLWAPWRMPYLESLEHELEQEKEDLAASAGKSADELSTPRCFLAEYWANPDQDAEHYVIHRNGHGIILLNRYPYSNGHLLVALGEGRPTLRDYAPEQRAEFWRLIEIGCDLIDRALNPQGKNVGINEGRAAGAGVPQHLHAHLVPRWSGDTNFITVVGDVRVVPSSLEAMYERFMNVLNADASA